MPPPLRIGVVGDIHTQWDARDAKALDEAAYDLILFVGDLGGYRARGAERVARRMARLRTRAFAIAGNHDAVLAAQLVAEAFPRGRAARGFLSLGQGGRVDALERALGQITLGGFSAHEVAPGADALWLVVARPHSMGGPSLAFERQLRRRYGVASLGDSRDAICRAVDETPAGARLLFLAHNGASGLGDSRDAICGRDFHRNAGDWGDPDLREAIDYARRSGRRVLASVSGHMHLRLKGGGRRDDQAREGGTLHLNVAEVPRHRRAGGGVERHHVCLEIEGDEARATTVWT